MNLRLAVQLITAAASVAVSISALAKSDYQFIPEMKQKPLARLPKSAPKVVYYYYRKASTPSCGLIPATAADSNPVPLIETDSESGDFPYCVRVEDAILVKAAGDPLYLYELVQKETREDSSQLFQFVRASATALKLESGFNSLLPSDLKSMKEVEEWLKHNSSKLK